MARGCSVFVGNIDFDIPEETLIQHLSTVGRVVSFRMVVDKQTGKFKGYGFCEYETPLIAETAVQKLKITLKGRPIRINRAEHDSIGKGESEMFQNQQQQLPFDKLKVIFDDMDKDQLKDVLKYLKTMSIEQPTKLAHILQENRSLSLSILYCLTELKLVDMGIVRDFLEKNFTLDENLGVFRCRIMSMDREDPEISPEMQAKLNKLYEKINTK